MQVSRCSPTRRRANPRPGEPVGATLQLRRSLLGRSVSRASLAPSREPPAPSKFASRNHRRAESDDEVTVAGVTGVW